MSVSLGGKKYEFKDLSMLRWRVAAQRLHVEFGDAFDRYLKMTSLSIELSASIDSENARMVETEKRFIESFDRFCNCVFAKKWYNVLGIKTFRASVLDIPLEEVHALGASFFERLKMTQR